MFKGLSLSEANDLVKLGSHVPHEILWVLRLMHLMKEPHSCLKLTLLGGCECKKMNQNVLQS